MVVKSEILSTLYVSATLKRECEELSKLLDICWTETVPDQIAPARDRHTEAADLPVVGCEAAMVPFEVISSKSEALLELINGNPVLRDSVDLDRLCGSIAEYMERQSERVGA